MGGATHSALTLIKRIRQMGIDVIVIVPNEDASFEKHLNNIGVNVYVVGLCFKAYPFCTHTIEYLKWPFCIVRTLFKNYMSRKKLEIIIKQEHVDIVHTNVGPIVCGYEVCKKLGVPHVWHIREYGDKDFNIKMIPTKNKFRSWLKQSYTIFITNDLMKYNCLNGYENAYVIYNGVRKKSDIHNVFPKDKYFLCASRISIEKGFDQIIRVFSVFCEKNPGFRLKIIGLSSDNYIKKLLSLSVKLKVANAIDFEGYKNNVSEYMTHATALLVGSPFEGFGRMTAEAAFAGCLVVGKNTAGTKEIMDIIGGYPFLTDEEMLDAMVTVSNLKEEDYRKKALYAQQKAVHFFSEESYVEKVMSVYKSIFQTENSILSKNF